MDSRIVKVEGMRVSVRSSDGRGPAIMMIHGNSSSSVAFRHQLEGPLGAKLRLVTLDLPGHGGSDVAHDPASTYTLPGFAAAVATVARELEIDDQLFVGWSLGGHILMEAMNLLPRASGFCILGAPPIRNPPNFDQAFLPNPVGRLLFQSALSDMELHEWIDSYSTAGDVVPDELVAELRSSDGRMRPALGASIAGAQYRDETEIVANLPQPLAVLHGEHDALINLDYLRSLHIPTLWRGAVQVIGGAGHAPQWTSPSAFDSLLDAFVTDVA